MFLDVLNKEEKDLFMDLAIKAAEANGEVATEEIRMLHAFASEMKISPRTESAKELSEILKELKEKSSKKSIKVITFELIGIFFADSEFDDAESNFLNTVTTTLGIENDIVKEMIAEINDYSAIFNRICKTVL